MFFVFYTFCYHCFIITILNVVTMTGIIPTMLMKPWRWSEPKRLGVFCQTKTTECLDMRANGKQGWDESMKQAPWEFWDYCWYSNNKPLLITIYMGGIDHRKWMVYYCYTHITVGVFEVPVWLTEERQEHEAEGHFGILGERAQIDPNNKTKKNNLAPHQKISDRTTPHGLWQLVWSCSSMHVVKHIARV